MSTLPPISPIDSQVAACGQLEVEHIAELAAAGYASLVNNRPDGEAGPEQPTSAQIETACHAHGMQYAYLPVIPGWMTDQNVLDMAQLLDNLPQPMLLFCRSGARSTALYQAAKR